jgi:chromosome segregation ATPase
MKKMSPDTPQTDPDTFDSLKEKLEHAAEVLEQSEHEVDETEEIYEASQESAEESREELKEAQEELDELHEELVDAEPNDVKDLTTQIEEKEREIERYREKFEKQQQNVEERYKAWKSAQERYQQAKHHYAETKRRFKEFKDSSKRKEKEEFTRINFTLPKEMKEEWNEFANEMKVNTSELIRTAMEGLAQAFKTGNFKSLGEWERKMENLGKNIEESVQNNLKKMNIPAPEEQTGEERTFMHHGPKIEADIPKKMHKTRQEIISELKGLKELLDLGIITQEEFEDRRKKWMADLDNA